MKVIVIAALLISASLALAAPTNKPVPTKNTAKACCVNGPRSMSAVKTAGVTSVNAAQSCPMENSCPRMGSANGVTAVNAAQSCPMENSCPRMGSANGVTAVNAAQSCPMEDSCPRMGSANGVTAVNAAQSCPMENSCPRMGSARLVKAGQVRMNAPRTARPKACGANGLCHMGADNGVGASTTPAKATLMKVAVKQCGDKCTCGKRAHVMAAVQNAGPMTCCANGPCKTAAVKNAVTPPAPAKATLVKVALKQCGDNCACGMGAHGDSDDNVHIFTMKGMKKGAPDGLGGIWRSMMGRHDDEADGADRPRLGVALTQLDGDDGLVVRSVMDGFPAKKAGLKQGDVIVSVNGEAPVTTETMRKALGAGRITLGIQRDGDMRQVTIKLDGERHQGMMGMGMGMNMGKGMSMGARGGKGDHGDHQVFTIHKRLDRDTLGELHEKFGKMGAAMRFGGRDLSAIQDRLLGALKDLGVNGEITIKLRVDDDEAESANKGMDFDVNIDLDDDAIAQISKALRDALHAVGSEQGENAQGAMARRMEWLRHLRSSATREHAGDHHGDRDHQGAEAEEEREHHARMKIERLRADRAQGHTARPHMRARMDQRRDRQEHASGHRNPDADARFKSLEERMERIEQLLQELLQQG